MKERFSISLPQELITRIDQAAKENCLSRSSVARMFLELIKHVPMEVLGQRSPILDYLQLNQKTGE